MIGKVLLVVLLAGCAFPAPLGMCQAPAPAPKDFDKLLQSAEKAQDENRDDDAIGLFRNALVQQPESEEALWYLGALLYEKAEYAEARDILRQFVTIRGDAGPGWALLGMCEFNRREYPRALEHLQRAMVQGTGDRKVLAQQVLYHLEALLTRFERYDESMALFAYGEPDASLTELAGLTGLRMPFLPSEIPPDSRELVELAGKAVLAAQAERTEEAKLGFKHLTTAFPNEPGVHFLYGAFLARQDPEVAAPEFERELQISPFHVLARIRLAEQRIAKRDFDGALTLARQAINIEPKRASAHLYVGEALMAKGDTAQGIKELEIARDGEPSVSRTRLDLLRAYKLVGRKEDADREKQEIEKLLHRDTSSRPRESGDTPRDQTAH